MLVSQACAALLKHAVANEMPYGPLLAHCWAKGAKYWVPPGCSYPCPELPNTDWTVVVEDLCR